MHSKGLIHCDIKPNNIALRRGEAVILRHLEAGHGFRPSVSLVAIAHHLMLTFNYSVAF